MIIDGEMDAMSAENALFSEITTQMQVNRNSLYSIISKLKKSCSIFTDICTEQGYKIHTMEVMEYHIHLFPGIHPSNSLLEVVQCLKEVNCYRFFKLHH